MKKKRQKPENIRYGVRIVCMARLHPHLMCMVQ